MLSRGFRRLFAAHGLGMPVLLGLATLAAAGCDKVPLTAPTESTITLFASGTSVPVNGYIDITATVIESAGTPVQNGTVVTFATTLGRIDPAEARTHDGKVTVRLSGDGRSGTATVTAFSGGASSEGLQLPVGAAAANTIVLRADPSAISGSGGTVQLIATVRDEGGNSVPGVPVTFSTTAGRLGATTVTTDQNGEARTTLTSSEQAEVTARAGSQSSDALTIPVNAGPSISITPPSGPIVAGQPVTFTITVSAGTGTGGTGGAGITAGRHAAAVQSITISYGDGSSDSLGNSTGTITAQHTYRRSGDYTVTVTARDVTGQESRAATVISVADAASIPVSIVVDTATPTINQPVSFTVTATPTGSTTVESYDWDFGDGSRAQETTGNTNSHVYNRVGNYSVTVTVNGSDGSDGLGRTVVAVAAPSGVRANR